MSYGTCHVFSLHDPNAGFIGNYNTGSHESVHSFSMPSAYYGPNTVLSTRESRITVAPELRKEVQPSLGTDSGRSSLGSLTLSCQ